MTITSLLGSTLYIVHWVHTQHSGSDFTGRILIFSEVNILCSDSENNMKYRAVGKMSFWCSCIH